MAVPAQSQTAWYRLQPGYGHRGRLGCSKIRDPVPLIPESIPLALSKLTRVAIIIRIDARVVVHPAGPQGVVYEIREVEQIPIAVRESGKVLEVGGTPVKVIAGHAGESERNFFPRFELKRSQSKTETRVHTLSYSLVNRLKRR